MTKIGLLLNTIADNLIEIRPDVYRVIDAKTSVNHNLVTKADLTSTCTNNQKVIYPLIDAIGTSNNKITKIIAKGRNTWRTGLDGIQNKVIQIESGVHFYVNGSTSDFTTYAIRNRIK